MAQYVEPHSGIHSWEDNKLFHKYEHGQLDNTAYKESIFGVNLVRIFPRFSRIRTEYGLRMQSESGKNADQKNSEYGLFLRSAKNGNGSKPIHHRF